MVLSKSQEGRSRRGPLERLAEAPSPAPTPSPTPGEDLGPQTSTSPGRLALSGRKFDYRVFAALPSSRPVYDMQVPGPSAGQPRTAPAAFPPAPASQACPSHSACLESCSVGAGPPQPAAILGPGLRGDPHPGSGGWLQAGLGCRPDLTLLPIAVPRFC
ncbi:translation initiation factor IF-2-like isoform X1 [Ursus maritimus]|uniref:Translation initiation factor IF-2-like isoform X1 n=1 Tax=Ursus maritimus TaxID=29073 RepID=A0A8M1FHR7_URSMA|nr:translation initiation factor IF-2-like isoform X1 [Ursus maritimus]XP_040481836.1 translation initiation factor IF-2-like isoform X1 [Ursus maritimus]